MVGLIWTIQSVHYPLFARVPAVGFIEYEREHTSRMGRLLLLPAGIEVVSGAALVWSRPADVDLGLVLLAGILLAVAWIVTALVQVPLHSFLVRRFDRSALEKLVRSNWIRTGLWSTRGILVALMLVQAGLAA